MARSGAFRTGLSPFGQGALNLDDVYRIESPQATTAPPSANPAPDRSTPPTDRGTIPVPKPPVVGKVPHPGTRKVIQKARPVARKPATVAPRKAPPKPVRQASAPDLYARLKAGQVLPKPPAARTSGAGGVTRL